MADIKKRHDGGCPNAGLLGGDCACAWRLDYRPLGMKGPRQRLEFPTKKAAERFRDETSHKASLDSMAHDPASCLRCAGLTSNWMAMKAAADVCPPLVVMVARSSREEPVRPRYFEPKTESGVRTVNIAPELVAALKIWKLQCPRAS
jgi:hypothetical protein